MADVNQLTLKNVADVRNLLQQMAEITPGYGDFEAVLLMCDAAELYVRLEAKLGKVNYLGDAIREARQEALEQARQETKGGS